MVTSDGRVYTWGWSVSGQLGHNDEQDELVPRELVGQFGGLAAVMLAAGWEHTVFLMTDGAVWACGSGSYGRLGLGDTAGRLVPARVGAEEAFGQSKVLTIACGDNHSMAVTEEGGLWSWGYAVFGMLGHNDQGNRLVPTRVATERFGGAKVVTAGGGCAHSAAVTADGAVYTWGRAAIGLDPAGLGHDDLLDKLVPTLVEPRHLLGARVGRCLPLSPLHALALAMGTHGRLGASGAVPAAVGGGGRRKSRQAEGKEPVEDEGKGSAVMALAGEAGLVQMVAALCGDWPEGAAGEGAGVVRLLGGGTGKKVVEGR